MWELEAVEHNSILQKTTDWTPHFDDDVAAVESRLSGWPSWPLKYSSPMKFFCRELIFEFFRCFWQHPLRARFGSWEGRGRVVFVHQLPSGTIALPNLVLRFSWRPWGAAGGGNSMLNQFGNCEWASQLTDTMRVSAPQRLVDAGSDTQIFLVSCEHRDTRHASGSFLPRTQNTTWSPADRCVV